jgi:hypothetical protein
MIQGALRRPHHFESHDAAFEFYRGKRAFAGIADKELMDYVIAAHAPTEQGVTLRFSGEWEACVYRSPPNLWSTLSKLAMPIHILGGNSSYVVTPSVAARLRGYDNLCVEMMDAAICFQLKSRSKRPLLLVASSKCHDKGHDLS